MSMALAFVLVVGLVIGAGVAFRRVDEARHLRFTDEAGSTTATLALARVEARDLLRHPTWLVAMLVIGVLVAVLILMDGSGSVNGDLPFIGFALVGIGAAALGLLVSAHRIGTRNRRVGLDELIAATPTSPRTRTTSLLLACLAPAPVIAVALAVSVVVAQIAYPFLPTPTARHAVLLLPQVLMAVGGAVVGVLMSRWLPIALGAVAGIAGVLFLNNGPGHLDPHDRWLRAVVEPSFGEHFDVVPVPGVLTFLVAVIVLGGCIALWWHGPTRNLVVATAVAVACIAGAGWTVTRPASADRVARVVSELEQPAEHQRCEVHGAVRACAYSGSDEWIATWVAAVDGVQAQAPAAPRLGRIDVVQRPIVDVTPYLPEVQGALDPAAVWPADRAVHPPMWMSHGDPDIEVAWQAAATLVGLPPAPDVDRPSGCLAGGQARVAVAHLLAARATPSATASFREVVDEVVEHQRWLSVVSLDAEYDYSAEEPQGEGTEQPAGYRVGPDGATRIEYLPVVGASGWGSDVMAADALRSADRAAVDRALRSHWDEIRDPATTTAQLMAWAGLDAPAPARGAVTVADPHACP